MTNQVNNRRLIPSTDVIQLTSTLKMITAQVVETSVTVNNSPIQGYVHPDDLTQPTYEMTPGLKPSQLRLHQQQFAYCPLRISSLFLSNISD